MRIRRYSRSRRDTPRCRCRRWAGFDRIRKAKTKLPAGGFSVLLLSELDDIVVRLPERLDLRQYRVLELRRVANESIRRSNPLDRRVEPGKALIRDRRRDLGPVPPGKRVFVSDDDA